MSFSPLDRNATPQKESRRMMLFPLKQHVLRWGTPSSIMPVLNFDTLKQRQRAERGAYASAFGLRIHRALSWLHRAELAAQEDHDLAFISLWIAFNAAYANDAHLSADAYAHASEQSRYQHFFDKLCDVDDRAMLYQLLWQEFPASVRALLDNPYIYQPFWDSQNGIAGDVSWTERFRQSKTVAQRALASQDTAKVLGLIFGRLYTLRNQIIHGGATWNSSANRTQLRDACRFMLRFIPVVLELMMDHPERFEGRPFYPLISQQ